MFYDYLAREKIGKVICKHQSKNVLILNQKYFRLWSGKYEIEINVYSILKSLKYWFHYFDGIL